MESTCVFNTHVDSIVPLLIHYTYTVLFQLLSKVGLNCHILQVLHQLFNVLALLDDAFKLATPLTNVLNCCF